MNTGQPTVENIITIFETYLYTLRAHELMVFNVNRCYNLFRTALNTYECTYCA
jgi:hypothetical protein